MEEDLSSRLTLTQETILDLYEKDSTSLLDHIRLWNAIRREHVLYFYARSHGITRLQGRPLPSSASAQSSAKDAIGQVLLLQSLQKSAYGSERWTLPETSRERLVTEPAFCFKKGGRQVTVTFDNDPENQSRYVLWDFIYFQDASDRWHKTGGAVSHAGLYYVDEEGTQVFYVTFAEEAEKFSSTGFWTVSVDGREIMPPNFDSVLADSTTQSPQRSHQPRPPAGDLPEDTGEPRRPASPEASETTSAARAAVPRGPRRRYRRRDSPPRQPDRGRGQHSERGEGARSRSRSRTRQGPGQGPGHPDSSEVVRGRAARLSAPTPEEVGRSTHTVESANRGRLERLLAESRDPPFIGLKGQVNSLKCTRYRYKQQYSRFFDKISTTWQWTVGDGPDRVGEGRILIVFRDARQRQDFLKSVPIPKSVTLFTGNAVGI